MTRLIDADAFCRFLREVSTRQHYEELLTQKDKYPTVADVIEEICCDLDGTSLNGFDNAPTVIPEEMKPLIEKTIEILPQLTDAIVENLLRILDDIDICQECEYRKTSFKEADNDYTKT